MILIGILLIRNDRLVVIVNIMDAALKWKQKENCKKVHRILTEYRGRKVDVKLKKEYNMIIV